MELFKKPWFIGLVAAGVAFLLWKHFKDNGSTTTTTEDA